jgi:hypothetical protein
VAVVLVRKKYPASCAGEQRARNEFRRDKKTFFEWYSKRIQLPDVLLTACRLQWKETDNPIYVWQAINFCTSKNVGFPDWVCQYLAECAERMLSPDAAKASDLRKVLPQIMGFPRKRGRGNPLEPDGNEQQYMLAASKFAREIANGAKPTVALRSAFERLDKKMPDRNDDKTLQSHIKKYFGISHAPRTNAEWKRAIDAWMIEVFGPFAKEYREISPCELERLLTEWRNVERVNDAARGRRMAPRINRSTARLRP